MRKLPKPRSLKEIVAEVEAITDRLGHPIDERIKPLVIGLRRFDLRTTMSCEGHRTKDQKGFRYPWIDVDSKDVRILMKLVQRQNAPIRMDGKRNKNMWVILPFLMDEVRLIPHDIRKPLWRLHQDVTEFAEFLNEVADAAERK